MQAISERFDKSPIAQSLIYFLDGGKRREFSEDGDFRLFRQGSSRAFPLRFSRSQIRTIEQSLVPAPGRRPEQLARLDVKHRGELADDLKTHPSIAVSMQGR